MESAGGDEMTSLTFEIMQELSKPFDAALVSWKPQATNRDKTKALAVPYVDPRAYIDRLNTVAGGNWSDDYQVMDGGAVVLCRLTIGGVTRADIGESSPGDQNTATSAIAQSFKRAAVKFGLGRYLYSLPKTWVEYSDQRRRFTDQALGKLARVAGGNGTRPTGGNSSKPSTNGNGGAFASPEVAIQWGIEQGAFNHQRHAHNAYQKLRTEKQPKTAAEMGQMWRQDIARRLAEKARDKAKLFKS